MRKVGFLFDNHLLMVKYFNNMLNDDGSVIIYSTFNAPSILFDYAEAPNNKLIPIMDVLEYYLKIFQSLLCQYALSGLNYLFWYN